MPGHDALNDIMNASEPKAYAAALIRWLQANQGILPRSLSLNKSKPPPNWSEIKTISRGLNRPDLGP